MQQPKIILSHEVFNGVGSWAITPILASSSEYIDNIILSHRNVHQTNRDLQSAPAAPKNKTSKKTTTSSSSASKADKTTNDAPSSTEPIETKWLILCEDQSIVDLKALINNLKNEDYTKVSSLNW